MKGIPIRVKDKVIGHLLGDVFHKTVKKSKHFMRSLRAWGIDKQALDDLNAKGCNVINIYDKENDVTYVVNIRDYNTLGILKDYGYGCQSFLKIGCFRIKDDKQGNLLDIPSDNP